MEPAATADERVIRLLEEIRDGQREHLALYREAMRNQEESIRTQDEAVRMQREAVRAQRLIVRGLIPLVLLLIAAYAAASLLLGRP